MSLLNGYPELDGMKALSSLAAVFVVHRIHHWSELDD
jgi:hypothetical protein